VKLNTGPAGSFRQGFHANHLGENVDEIVLGDSDAQHETITFPQVVGMEADNARLGRRRLDDDGNRDLFGSGPKGPHSGRERAGTGRTGINRNHWLCGFRGQLGWRLTVGLFPDYRPCGSQSFGESFPDGERFGR